jgi:hypothetical protein
MEVKGLVYRIEDGVYLSLIGSDDVCTDGIPISEGVYETLENNQISYVDVKIRDGTIDIEDMDVFYFIYEFQPNYNPGDLFYFIKDSLVFTFDGFTIKEICDNGDFQKVAKDIIEEMKSVKINE